MKVTLLFILFFCQTWAQPPLMELQPYGFDAIDLTIPTTPNDKLLSLSKNWAQEYNFQKGPVDVTDVTDNSMTISAFKKHAFYYHNRGDVFDFRIHYTIKLTFYQDSYTLQFNVGDIYTDGDVLIEYKLPDYFESSGELKDGYSQLDESLQKTVNDIVNSHYNFIINFR